MKLIDADKLKTELDAWARIIQNPDHYMRADALHIIDTAPEIDAVPVVRCKDCKFKNTSWYDKRDMLEEFCRWDRDESPNDDDYCSYGERKEVER
jgi:hypothetical protein